MQYRWIVFFAALSTAATASAHEHRPAPGSGPCEELKMTEAQKAQLKDAHLKFEEERIDLEAKEKHARLDLRKALGAKDADDKTIRKATQAAADASAKLHTADEVQRIDTLLKVFKPEQRSEALHCMFRFGPHPGHFGMNPHGPRGGHGPGHRFAAEDEGGDGPQGRVELAEQPMGPEDGE